MKPDRQCTTRSATLDRPTAFGTIAFPRAFGIISSGRLACPWACRRPPMHFVGSTRSIARACRLPPSRLACCRMCCAGRPRNRIQSRRRRRGSRRRGRCPRVPTSLFLGRAANGPEKFEEVRKFESALFRAATADTVVYRAMIEVGQLLQPQSRLKEPDITQRIETLSIKAAA